MGGLGGSLDLNSFAGVHPFPEWGKLTGVSARAMKIYSWKLTERPIALQPYVTTRISVCTLAVVLGCVCQRDGRNCDLPHTFSIKQEANISRSRI
jgi:hypothetical protein